MKYLFSFTIILIAPLPSIVGFAKIHQQVREEEGEALICLLRRRNLDRNDTVTVLALEQEIGEELATGICLYTR